MKGGAVGLIFDNYDCEFLKLCGLCRYMPSGIVKKFNSPVLRCEVAHNLQEHGLIRKQNNDMSYKLTGKGAEILADMGYEFPADSRTRINSLGYRRKLISAQWNVLLYLAGINIFHRSVRELEGNETGYVSSLILRANNNVRVLAGTRFHGLLKIRDCIYIPYHVEGVNDWIFPGYEKEVFTSQSESVQNIKRLCLVLFGNSLEELWEYVHPKEKSPAMTHGRKCFDTALEELGCENILVPLTSDGVLQVSVLCIRGYGKSIAKALGCDIELPDIYSRCDGIFEGTPLIVAVDMNADRIRAALLQVKLLNTTIVPKVVCLSFQRNVLMKILHYFNCQKCTILTVKETDLRKIFPEIPTAYIDRRPFIKKDGRFIEVNERYSRCKEFFEEADPEE